MGGKAVSDTAQSFKPQISERTEHIPFTTFTLCFRETQTDTEQSGSTNQGCIVHCCHLSPGRVREPAECRYLHWGLLAAQHCHCKLSALQRLIIQMSVQAPPGNFFFLPGEQSWRIFPDRLNMYMQPEWKFPLEIYVKQSFGSFICLSHRP